MSELRQTGDGEGRACGRAGLLRQSRHEQTLLERLAEDLRAALECNHACLRHLIRYICLGFRPGPGRKH